MYELFQIDEALGRAGITPPRRAFSIKPCPNNKPRLTVFIDARGRPVDLALAPVPRRGENRQERWAPDNQMGFPTLAVGPLLALEDTAPLTAFQKACKASGPEAPAKLAAAVSGLLDAAEPGWTPETHAKIQRQLRGGERLLEATGPLPPQAAALDELIRRCVMVETATLEAFLRERAAADLRAAPLEWAPVVKGVAGVFKKDGTLPTSDLLLTFEPDDWQRFPSLANSPRVFDCLSELLLSAGPASTEAVDAFGLPLAGHLEPMPKLMLPKSGEKPMRSMFGEVPANYRYSRADSVSFPVGSEARERMIAASKWIMDPEREGRTWAFLNQKTTLGRASLDPTIVLIVPQEMPPTPPALGRLFAPLSAQARQEATARSFAAAAEDVASALRGAWRGDLSVPIQVSVITSYDKGRYKLLMSAAYSAEHFIDSARGWQAGCANIPEMRFLVASAKDEYALVPDVPLPSEVSLLLATVWLRSGEDCRTTRQVPQDLPAKLLLEGGPQGHDLALALLRQHLDDHVPVLLALGQSGKKKDKEKRRAFKAPRAVPYRIEILPSVLGLLLHKAGRPKEVYMKDAYFLVGRLLNLADTIHEQYCLAVRKGSVPPALLGNSLMRTALQNPVEALEQLADRLLVYLAWARSSQEEDSRLAKWAMGQSAAMSEALHKVGVPSEVDPAGKAEMLLGYLAGPPKKSAPEEATQDNKE